MKLIRLNDRAEVIEKGNTFYLRVPQQQQNRSGDEAARIEAERLAAEVIEHSHRYQQMTGGER